MKRARKVLVRAGAVLVVALIAFAVFVASRQSLRFDRALPDIHASHDPAIVARGEYVVRRLGNCALCHGAPAQLIDALHGATSVPLSGGRAWSIPPGTFRAYNITSDTATGIGGVSDGQLARALRFGIGREGRALLPFMEMQGLADDDLTAVISYLRTLPPSRSAVPSHAFSLLGKVVKATVLANPVGSKTSPPKTAPRGATLENGRYLVESVANCWACHTERDMKTGEMVGPHLGGGTVQDDIERARRVWHAPNLTSDPKTGRTGQLTEEQFVSRMKAGRVFEFSPMPWNSFSQLADDDLRAIYRYLHNVPPVERDVGQSLSAL